MIAIVKSASIVILAIKLILSPALAVDRNENLPPGEHMDRIEWIEVPMADPFHLIVCSKSVQKELGITREQLNQFREMEPLFRSELRDLSYRKNQNPKNDIQRHMDMARDGMDRILNPDQLKRLRQLLLQLHGPCSILNDPKLFRLLKITEQQEKKMNSILHALMAKSEQIYAQRQNSKGQIVESVPAPSEASNQKQMQHLLRILNSKVYRLLSDEQKKIYKAAEGKPFEFRLESNPACLGSVQ